MPGLPIRRVQGSLAILNLMLGPLPCMFVPVAPRCLPVAQVFRIAIIELQVKTPLRTPAVHTRQSYRAYKGEERFGGASGQPPPLTVGSWCVIRRSLARVA